MLCPEVWSFDSPALNANVEVKNEWNEIAKKKLFAKIERSQEMSEFVTVIIPNCSEEDQATIVERVKDCGSSYTVQGLSLQDLIDPLFIEGFVKRGKFYAISTEKDLKGNCIVSITPDGKLNVSVDKETFQSLRLEGKPVQSNRKEVEKYVCSINLLDDTLLKTTKNREIILNALGSEFLPPVTLSFKWVPAAEDICDSSSAKFFSDRGYAVNEIRANVKHNEELSRRVASFTDLLDGDKEDMLEHLGMLALDCSQTADEYLNSYQYSGEMVRVKNTLVVRAKGMFIASDLQVIVTDVCALNGHNDCPWVCVNTLGYTRTPFCERFYEDFHHSSSERGLTFVLNSLNQALVQEILPIVKNFSK